MVNKLIQAMIVIVIGLALLPVIMDFVNDLTGTDGALEDEGALVSLVELLPILFVIILIVGAIAYVRTSSK